MESDWELHVSLYDIFLNEYIANGQTDSYYIWFNKHKPHDLGIKYAGNSTYLIIDEKKWFLTKIKYGF